MRGIFTSLRLLLILAVVVGSRSRAGSYGEIRCLPIGPVWSGVHVGFDFVRVADHEFVAYYDEDRKMTVASRRVPSPEWTLARLPVQVEWNIHNRVALGVDRENHLHVCGNMHHAPLVYFRSRKPLDASSLERIDRMIGTEEDRVTYPDFLTAPDGELVFSYRDGRSGRASNYFNVYDPDSRTWRRLLDRPLFTFEAGSPMSAYPTGPVVRNGLFHLAWVWRDLGGADRTHDLCYARSRDLVHWEKSDGTPITLPITLSNSEVVDPVPTRHGLLNGAPKIGFDAAGRIVISYHREDDQGNMQIYNARREATGWRIHAATDWKERWRFSGGGAIERRIRVSSVSVDAAGRLIQPFWHRTQGSGQWVLDPATLEPVAEEALPTEIPGSLLHPEGQGFVVHTLFARDRTGRALDGGFLRWETRPRTDSTRTPSPPSTLRLYEQKRPWLAPRDLPELELRTPVKDSGGSVTESGG